MESENIEQEISQVQKQFFTEMIECRTHLKYLNLYAAMSSAWERNINMFLAITSSTSIAAWAIWQEYKIVWAILIALSQVVTAIKPFLPFKKRTEAVYGLSFAIQHIANEYLEKWYEVSNSRMTEKDINKLSSALRIRTNNAEKEWLKDEPLPVKNKIRTAAWEETKNWAKSIGLGDIEGEK